MFSKLSLLQKVALAAALPILVLGFVLQRGLEAQVRQRALANAVASTKLIATLGIQPQLSSAELTSGLSDQQVAEDNWPASRSGTATRRSCIRTITA